VTEQNPPPPAAPVQEGQPQVVIDATPQQGSSKGSEEEALGSLKEMQESVGQISELAKEEENLVKEFFGFLLRILKSFSNTLEISVSSLPEEYNGQVNKAYLYLTGQLVLVYKNGEVRILNLADQENHGILVEITGEIMTKLKTIVGSHKAKIEKRVKFLMSVTKELQRAAKAFSEE
jgi:hypothetical protein